MRAGFVIALLLSGICAFGQEKFEWFVHLNAGIVRPSASDKGIYPLIGYDKDARPKFQLGTIGAGVTGVKPLSEQFDLKVRSGLIRAKYWDTPLMFLNGGNVAVAGAATHATEWLWSVGGGVNYNLSPGLSVGSGINLHALISSSTRISFGQLDERIRNRFYKTIVPVIPVEMTLTKNRFAVSLQFERSLVNRYRGDLADVKNLHYSTLMMQVAYRISSVE